MTHLSAFVLIFLGISSFFIFFHLMMGKLLRPSKVDAEKQTVYECGEPSIGSAWIQFDLRFYVVALLFVIFDVEVVFFFPWAVVFGSANQAANVAATPAERFEAFRMLAPQEILTAAQAAPDLAKVDEGIRVGSSKFALLSFADIGVFFFVLLVGFAYLWKRGDLDWVRTTIAEQPLAAQRAQNAEASSLVGSAS